jgi:parallel beta-helix repeat protein
MKNHLSKLSLIILSVLIVVSAFFFSARIYFNSHDEGSDMAGVSFDLLTSTDSGPISLAKLNNALTAVNDGLDDATLLHESSYSHANYNTAYSWGNHAAAGYFDDVSDFTSTWTFSTTTTVCIYPETCEFQATSSNANVVIQNAINAIGSGGKVYIKAGTYDIDSRIIILSSNVLIQGDGQATKLVLANGVNTEIIVIGDASRVVNNVHVSDLYLDGNKANNAGACGYSGCTKNLLRYRSDAQNSYGGVVSNVYATNGSQNGLSFESHAFCTMINNIATNNNNFGIWFENGTNMKVIGNDTASNTMAGIKGLDSGGVIVSNNNSKGDFGTGIALQGVSGVISGNVIYRAGWASTHQSAATGISVSMSSNLNITSNNIYGSYGHGMELNQTTKSVISNNVFERNGQKTNNTYSDIRLYNATGGSTDNVFTGNTFDNETAAYYDNKAKYNISADAGDVHIRNYFAGNIFGTPSTTKMQALDIEGGGTVKGNTFGFNENLNPSGYYSYGYCDGTQTIDPGKGDFLRCAGYDGTTNLTIASGVYEGQKIAFKFDQDSGSKTISWAANIKLAGGSITLSSGAGQSDIIQFIWDGTNWREVSRSLNN